MTEIEMSSEPLINMDKRVGRALDEKGKKPSQLEVAPDQTGNARSRESKPPVIPPRSLTDKNKKPRSN